MKPVEDKLFSMLLMNTVLPIPDEPVMSTDFLFMSNRDAKNLNLTESSVSMIELSDCPFLIKFSMFGKSCTHSTKVPVVTSMK